MKKEPEIKIVVYSDKYKEAVQKLIFDIAEIELGRHSKSGRPDIKNIPEFYQRNERENFWLAIDENDNVVGTIALSDRKKGNGELQRMYVRQDMRRRGIATKLLEALLSFARAKKYKAIYLTTVNEPGAKHYFYKNNGFKITESLPEEIKPSKDSMFYKLKIK